ncbi:hypothetical protein ABVN80_21655 [Acinetobacter baumannii]
MHIRPRCLLDLEIYNNAPTTQANFTQELKLLGYKTSSNYDKSGTYVAQGSNMYVHTRGFDHGDSVGLNRFLELSFANDQVVEVRSTKPSSTERPFRTFINWGIYPQHNEDRVLIKLIVFLNHLLKL